jgi:hypothetical protein
MTLNRRFTAVYVAAGAAIAVTEGVAVIRRTSGHSGETVTQHWRWIDDHLVSWPRIQHAWHMLNAGLLIWLIVHLLDARERLIINVK